MTIDRYTKAVLTAIAIALSAIALNSWASVHPWPQAIHVQPAEAEQPRCPRLSKVEMPAEWGKIVGTVAVGRLGSYLVLDTSGEKLLKMIRFVSLTSWVPDMESGCPVVEILRK